MQVRAYNEEHTYSGEYEQVQDYGHRHRPTGPGWYLIRSGWARGGSHPLDRSVPAQRVLVTPELSASLCNIEDVEKYVSEEITDFFPASEAVHSQLGNMRDRFRKIDDMVRGFADMKKPKVAHLLSAYVGYLHNLSPDFRNIGKPIPRYREGFLAAFKKYIGSEQEIIRAAGIVNNDGTVTLFRNTDSAQIKDRSQLFTPYRGNNFESWTTNPGLSADFTQSGRTKVMARVPLRACLASCIGRRKRPFMFNNKHECEIMVCGAYIDIVQNVGTDSRITLAGLKESYLDEVGENIKRETSARAADSKTSMVRLLVNAARELLEEREMTLEKSIEHGKEHRRQYYKNAQRVDRQCRPHGSCPWCYNNRMHNTKVRELDAREQEREE